MISKSLLKKTKRAPMRMFLADIQNLLPIKRGKYNIFDGIWMR